MEILLGRFFSRGHLLLASGHILCTLTACFILSSFERGGCYLRFLITSTYITLLVVCLEKAGIITQNFVMTPHTLAVLVKTWQ